MSRPPSNRAAHVGVVALLLALSAAVFYRSLDGEFLYDDIYVVLRNPEIRHGLRNLPELFTGSYWDFLDPETAQRVGYWRPLSSAALSVAHVLGNGAPKPFHALSLCAHLAATALAYVYVLRLSRKVGS